eukprot:13957124-Alexandrium_andersonii.AAC.1
MSASLVGSEMCIRDSTGTQAHAVHWGEGAGRGAVRGAVAPRRALPARAVSYTHLTLPTICSV